MIDPVGDQAYPVSSRAFETLAAPQSRVMARNVVALFLTSAGRVLHITSLQPAQPGLRATWSLRLGRRIPARTALEDIEMPVDDLKVMLWDCATIMRDRPMRQAWWLVTAPLDQVRAALDAAHTHAQVHAALPVAPGQASLDLL